MSFFSSKKKTKNLRVIKTGRDSKSINSAVNKGFTPLVKQVIQSKKIKSNYCVLQHTITKKIKVIGDFRFDDSDHPDSMYKAVIPWTTYYPYKFESPYAAYLLPHDLKIGERVFLEDLIEDIVGAEWNQGSKYRLESCEAIWNGRDFEIQFDPKVDKGNFIG